jgi:hypothetical protein
MCAGPLIKEASPLDKKVEEALVAAFREGELNTQPHRRSDVRCEANVQVAHGWRFLLSGGCGVVWCSYCMQGLKVEKADSMSYFPLLPFSSLILAIAVDT